MMNNVKPKIKKISEPSPMWEATYISEIGVTYRVVSKISSAQAMKDWYTKYARVFGLPSRGGG
jgi:hypothetical protein